MEEEESKKIEKETFAVEELSSRITSLSLEKDKEPTEKKFQSEVEKIRRKAESSSKAIPSKGLSGIPRM
jgi:hypothetical protein